MGSGGSEGWEQGCTAAPKRKEQIIGVGACDSSHLFFCFPPEFLRLLAVSKVRVLTAFCASPSIPSHTRRYKSPPAHHLSVCLLHHIANASPAHTGQRAQRSHCGLSSHYDCRYHHGHFTPFQVFWAILNIPHTSKKKTRKDSNDGVLGQVYNAAPRHFSTCEWAIM